jgi:hypothetical protein
MVRLAHDSGEATTLKCEQALGDDSTLEFDENGHAYVDDKDDADLIAALHKHVTVEPAAPDTAEEDGKGTKEKEDGGTQEGDDGFDAAAFVDRTPMSDVVDDLESGDYDEHLDAIAAAEADSRDRDGVKDAIENRRE